MAAGGYYDQDGQWIEPGESQAPGREQAPNAPVGYTVPTQPVGPTGPAPDPTTPPPPGPGPDPTTPPTTTPGGFGQFTGQFTAPDWFNNPDAPQPDLPTWKGPDPFHYADYKAPTPEEALNDPGYKFGVGQGLDALQRWAAAKGTLNDTGTANALVDYGLNAAGQQYKGVSDRSMDAYRVNRGNALDTYNTNYNTQYVDPYKFSYQSALDMNAPRIQGWQANVASTAQRNQLAQEHAWSDFMRTYDQWKFNTGNDLAG